MTIRRWIALAATAATLVACQGASERDPAADLRLEQVGPVHVEVPASWQREDLDANGLVASSEFVPTGTPDEHVQVIVGCGAADADDLVIATVQQPRDGLVVTNAEDARSVRVDGMDTARRTVLTFGAGRADDANTVRTYGLYAASETGLVVVEYSSTVPTFHRELGVAILDSVAIDPQQLTRACSP